MAAEAALWEERGWYAAGYGHGAGRRAPRNAGGFRKPANAFSGIPAMTSPQVPLELPKGMQSWEPQTPHCQNC